MPIQSYLMMYFAGSAWQYGKRKISAMSNEEFNKLDMKTLLEQHTMELKSVIPTLENSLNDITPLIRILIEQYGDFIKEALKALPQALLNAIGQSGGQFANVPTTDNTTGGNVPATMASFLHFFKTLSDATNIPESELIKDTSSTTSTVIDYSPTKQDLIDEAMLKAKLRAQKTPEIKPQLSIFEKARGKKRKAGQSQKLERIKLGKAISFDGKNVRPGGAAYNRKGTTLAGALARLKQNQQKMINLLARYDFS